jgi:hypothetical protein
LSTYALQFDLHVISVLPKYLFGLGEAKADREQDRPFHPSDAENLTKPSVTCSGRFQRLFDILEKATPKETWSWLSEIVARTNEIGPSMYFCTLQEIPIS